jgi:hypothetical protein
LVFGFWFLVFGFWFLVLGFGLWVLGFGFWVLGFGFWVLGFGFWVLFCFVLFCLFCLVLNVELKAHNSGPKTSRLRKEAFYSIDSGTRYYGSLPLP